MAGAMGYKGLWVMRGMGYEGFNCSLKLNEEDSMSRFFKIKDLGF